MVELSTGVKIEVKAVPAFVIKKVQDQLAPEKPKVPTQYIKEDDRTIEVPENPDYQAALLDHRGKVIEATYDAAIVLGTKVLDVGTLQKIDDTDWADDLRFVGIDVPQNGRGRYLAWMKYYACARSEDLNLILDELRKVMGVSEEEAAKAAEQFRRSAGR